VVLITSLSLAFFFGSCVLHRAYCLTGNLLWLYWWAMTLTKRIKFVVTALFSLVSLSSLTHANSVFFRNVSENPVSIWAQVSLGSVPYEGGLGYIDDVEVAPGESVDIPVEQYWHLYLIGTDLVTGESWDNDFNPGVHAPYGNLQLDGVGAYNGGGFSISSIVDPEVSEAARTLTLGLNFANGQWEASAP